jgi:glycosyltransferase involved in cell wall biosynthesis
MEMILSIVIPVYNEEGSIEELYGELKNTLKNLPDSTEVIFIDDGSTDGSTDKLRKISGEDEKFKLIVLGRNYGQTAAMASGIKFARGNIIVTLDADLQNKPDDIPKLIEQMHKGYDVVSGWRKKRKDAFLSRRLPSGIANWMISCLTGVKLHDYGCTLKAYKSEFIKNLSLHGEMHRFLPAYCFWHGARITEVEVGHFPRIHGKSKYSLNRVFKVMLDLLVVKFLLSYLGKPIYIFGGIAITSFLLGSVVNVYVVVRKVFFSGSWLSPLFFIGFILWTFSVTCIFLGLLAEILVRLYLETGKYTTYRISDKVNI